MALHEYIGVTPVNILDISPLLVGFSLNNVSGHTTNAPPVGFELAIKGIQCYANKDKTSIQCTRIYVTRRALQRGALRFERDTSALRFACPL